MTKDSAAPPGNFWSYQLSTLDTKAQLEDFEVKEELIDGIKGPFTEERFMSFQELLTPAHGHFGRTLTGWKEQATSIHSKFLVPFSLLQITFHGSGEGYLEQQSDGPCTQGYSVLYTPPCKVWT